jgi:hypothetical protein
MTHHLLWKRPYDPSEKPVTGSGRKPEKEHCTELLHTLYIYILR